MTTEPENFQATLLSSLEMVANLPEDQLLAFITAEPFRAAFPEGVEPPNTVGEFQTMLEETRQSVNEMGSDEVADLQSQVTDRIES